MAVGVAVSLIVYRRGLDHPRGEVFGTPGDSELFVWSFKWVPWAITHGHFPLVSHAVFSTTGGINLAHNTFAPLGAIVLWPVTALFGPVFSYNLYAMSAPTLDMVAAYYLLRFHLGRFGSLVGAFFFAFSPILYMAGSGHPQVNHIWALLFGLGLIAHSVFGDDRRLARRRAIGGGALLGLQLYMGVEMMALAVVVVVSSVLILASVDNDFRSRVTSDIWHRLRSVGVAAISAVLVGLPFLLTFTLGPEKFFGVHQFQDINVADAANIVVPTPVSLFDGPEFRAIPKTLPFPGGEWGAYLGLPLVVLLVVVTFWKWRLLSTYLRLAVVAAWVGVVLSLGAELDVWGRNTHIALPWAILVKLPIIKSAIPTRITVFTALAVGAIAGWVLDAMSTAVMRPIWRVVVIVGLVMCLPGGDQGLPGSFPVPTATASRQIAQYCGPHARAIAVPRLYQHHVLLIQAQSGFRMDLVRGFGFRASSTEFGPVLSIDAESGVAPDPAGIARVSAELRQIGANCVLAMESHLALWTVPPDRGRLAALLGAPCHRIGETCVWRVRSS